MRVICPCFAFFRGTVTSDFCGVVGTSSSAMGVVSFSGFAVLGALVATSASCAGSGAAVDVCCSIGCLSSAAFGIAAFGACVDAAGGSFTLGSSVVVFSVISAIEEELSLAVVSSAGGIVSESLGVAASRGAAASSGAHGV